MAYVCRLRRNGKAARFPAAGILGTLIVALWMCRPCSPTTVLAITDGRNNQIVIAADSLVQHRYGPAESRCKIHVVTNDCTFAMAGMYKQDTPAFDLFALGQSACRSSGDLKQKADYFLSAALPQLVEIMKDLAITDADYLKQHNEGKPIIEVLFVGAYEGKPAAFARGVVPENGILKPEVINVPSDRVHLFAGVNGHIRAYINSHPRWEQGGDINAAQRLIELEAAAHSDMVGLPISIGVVASSGRFRWIHRGRCEE